MGIWFLLELLILFWFGRDIFARLGRRSFWILVGWGVITASVVAVALDLLGQLVPGISGPAPFALLQGQRTLLVIVIAAFATLFGNATVLLFFVLPVQAKWFLWIEILFAFMGFLGTKDLAGFVGICATVGVVYNLLTRGGLARGLRELWLRFEQRRIQAKMARMRRRSGLRVVKGDDDGAARRSARSLGSTDDRLAWNIHEVRSEVPQMPGDTRRRDRGHRRRIWQYVEGRDGDAQSERNAVDSGSCGTAVGAS